MTEKARILLIDDDSESSKNLQTVLSFLGEKTITAQTSNWQKKASTAGGKHSDISAAIIGNCSERTIEKILNDIYCWESSVPFVLIGEHSIPSSFDTQLQIRITARLSSALNYQSLLDALHKAKTFQDQHNRLPDFEGGRDYNMFRSLVGKSESVQQVRRMMGQVANKDVSVLITGESGTGKEVVARNLHLNSNRSDKPFIPINCGAISKELLESELFGHEKGAFTGAIASRAGRFELAEGGTLFLDEIGDMPLDMQVKLLRVLQERSFERVGGVNTLQVDVRILAATHKDLEEMIEKGDFRQDLYYRINVFPIEMPSLRERPEDIPLLLNELITIMEAEKRGSVRFNSGAIAALCNYTWPGNVRELANLVERMSILFPHGIVGINDLPMKFQKASEQKASSGNNVVSDGNYTSEQDGTETLLPLNGLDLREYLANLERGLIGQALSDSDGVVAQAAGRLHMGRTTLVEKMRKYNMQKKSENNSNERNAIEGKESSNEK
ncbi:MAG: sigma-54-dependent Fis family transcriptional regulator [SAR86 cluster bacterium]|uniref:Sigma-54-dependent Fis family transcriptional regulator n=1 Tax=SAR86 cluster bacterium TaxID=2030880 RepID=A0A2A5AFM9_9GAMM|nr:MAG: sigma-54-dependent Fis family transcriptional regulator [SAR86 cluster bacterium]